jgi:hypothetical protein
MSDTVNQTHAKRFRKRPVTVTAMRLGWDTWSAMCDFVGVGPEVNQAHGCYVDAEGLPHSEMSNVDDRIGLLIPTLEGVMLATEGDWVVRGVKGEFYPCRADIFDLTYEPDPDQ